MLSGIFIDRPRLALVTSVVITLAGLLALAAIPVAQFPDIVPPQVQVSASYPGAGAEVVEAVVAQPIESRVVGADSRSPSTVATTSAPAGGAAARVPARAPSTSGTSTAVRERGQVMPVHRQVGAAA